MTDDENGRPMTMTTREPTARILHGDALTVLRGLPAESVQCAVTSPPYWGLRDYGTEPQVWDGTEEGCDHEWGERADYHDVREGETVAGKSRTSERFYGDESRRFNGNHQKHHAGQFCLRCGAWCGELGQEPDPSLYVAHLVQIFREVRRVLRPDGTCWLNLGDSFATSDGIRESRPQRDNSGDLVNNRIDSRGKQVPGVYRSFQGLAQKQMLGIPWRVAFALQADGWYLRSDVIEEVELYCPCGCGYVLEERVWRYGQDREMIWKKPNPMPESVRDRPTKSHEYLFLLSKRDRYFYDAEAVAEPAIHQGRLVRASAPGAKNGASRGVGDGPDGSQRTAWGFTQHDSLVPTTRNRRSVLTLSTVPFSGAHFAVMPEKLVEIAVLAGSSPRACERCGAPWQRITEQHTDFAGGSGRAGRTAEEVNGSGKWAGKQYGTNIKLGPVVSTETTGWRPTCSCPRSENTGAGHSLVLDPFAGAATVPLVAMRLGRDAVGIEVKDEYVRMGEARLASALGLWRDSGGPGRPASLPLIDEEQEEGDAAVAPPPGASGLWEDTGN